SAKGQPCSFSPARELARQIHQEVNKCLFQGIRSAGVHGGTDWASKTVALLLGPDLVTATPGRLDQLLELGAWSAWTTSFTWCSTKPTACWTWASVVSSIKCARIGRL
ncbi:ATP-dependent RNA helicase DED1-like, partial [Tropilaelaps mercedesae]